MVERGSLLNNRYRILEILGEARTPATVVTRSTMVVRDLEVLRRS